MFGGIAIYNILKRYDAEIIVYVEGLAASIASVIAMAGDKIIIPANAMMMIHKPSSTTWGNADDMRKMADVLDGCQKVILNTYMQHVKEGISEDDINDLMNAETWKNGKEWEEYFDIEVSEKNLAAACDSEYFDYYSRLPEIQEKSDPPQIDVDRLVDTIANKLKGKMKELSEKEILEDLDLI